MGDVPAGTPHAVGHVTYISWAESCSRSDHTARELGGRSHMVYAARFGSKPSTVLFKYLEQWKATSRILRDEQPDVVFVMTPPLFAALPAFWYAWTRQKRVVLDAHTGAFLNRRWRHLQWLQRILCRRAATTIVHNEHLATVARSAGGHVTIVPDVPVLFEELEPFRRPPEFTVAVVCSFNYDEPVEAIFDAAALLPDVRFFVTGNPKRVPAALAARLPANVTLTGFLTTPAYGGLLTAADAVLTLTTLDHTMLRGAYEATYQGTPVIVSDWPILRQSFSEGAVHVDNTSGGIAEGVRTLRRDLAAYRDGARRLRDRKLRAWGATRQAILDRLEAHPTNTADAGSTAR